MSGELIAKLESASEGSRELDAAIARHLSGNPADHWYDFLGSWVTDSTCAPVTTSIDAALALAERVLPGTTFRIDLDGVSRVWAFDKETFWNIHATINSRPKDWSAHSQANTPALAICAALLRASAAEGVGG